MMVLLATSAISYDYHVSNRRRKKYGASSELNPLVSRLAAHVGQRSAMLAVTIVPHVFFTIVALVFDWRLGYAFYCGFAFKQAMMQLASLALEQEIDAAIASSLGAARRGNPPPSSADADRGPKSSSKLEGK